MSHTDDPLAPPTAASGEGMLLTVRGLSKSFGDNQVLRSIDLEVRRGEVVVLIGPSGSGKTTVLRSLNGLETPDGGTIAFAGAPQVDLSRPLSNTFISLVKDSSLASLILVTEMFRRAQEIAAFTFEFMAVYLEAALIYWVICIVLAGGQGMLEKRLDRYVAH